MASARPYWKNGIVYIAVRHREKRTLATTGFKVERRDWNPNAAEVRKSHRDFRTINDRLAELVTDAETLITESVAEGRDPDPATIAARLGGAPVRDRSFVGYAKEVVEGYRLRGQISTWRAYTSAVNQLEEWGGDVKFSAVTPRLVRRFHTHLASSLSQNTVHKYVSSIKTLYKRAQDEGLVSYSERPFSAVKLRKENAIKEKVGTDEVRKIAAVDLGGLDAVIRDAWMFAFYAGGMRFGDVAFFRRKHLLERRGEVRSLYKMGKTEGVHGVLLVDEAVRILDRYGWRGKAPDELVFPLLDGYDLLTALARHRAKSARNAYANKRLKVIAKKAGIKKRLTFHMSRHAIGGYLLEQGHDVRTIQQILGHASIRITEHYLRGFGNAGPDSAMRGIDI